MSDSMDSLRGTIAGATAAVCITVAVCTIILAVMLSNVANEVDNIYFSRDIEVSGLWKIPSELVDLRDEVKKYRELQEKVHGFDKEKPVEFIPDGNGTLKCPTCGRGGVIEFHRHKGKDDE